MAVVLIELSSWPELGPIKCSSMLARARNRSEAARRALEARVQKDRVATNWPPLSRPFASSLSSSLFSSLLVSSSCPCSTWLRGARFAPQWAGKFKPEVAESSARHWLEFQSSFGGCGRTGRSPSGAPILTSCNPIALLEHRRTITANKNNNNNKNNDDDTSSTITTTNQTDARNSSNQSDAGAHAHP